MPDPPPGRAPVATVAITTRNRRDDLRRALASAVSQEGDLELLVVDDGSTDQTAEMVREEFPQVRLERFATSAGLIARRNDLAALASAPVLVSLDDDAEFTAPDAVLRALEPFADPRVGAVAIPYVERGRGETQVRQRSPVAGALYATGPYIGTAHALRIDVFQRLGGYRASLVRNTEELDYWTRMLDAGYVTALGWGPEILHHESPKRVVADVVYYDCRNNLLHAWRNVPMPYAAARAAKVVAFALAVVARRTGHPGAVLRGLAAAVGARGERRPVSRSAYRLGREIRYRGPVALDRLGLPAPAAPPAAPAAPPSP
ncbi:MAG: hypothetical protein QOE28_3057 [Solirubrobacteraceae bacterium]|jgi:glycosyltransferase involved in cell wall biosynthesis|nr:hypothetical protein [Solirubrobacteraceae bacterium]